MDTGSKKIKYLRSKQSSMDRSNPQILTSSPILEAKKTHSKLPDFLKSERNIVNIS